MARTRAEFSLESKGLGNPHPRPRSQDLRPLSQRYLPYFWRWAERAAGWTRGPLFWLFFVALIVLAVACWHARTLEAGQRSTGALILAGALAGALVGEIGSRLVLPAPTRVTYKTTATTPIASQERPVFMIPTDRGFRHSPNMEVVVVHPAARDTPTLYKTNSLGYRNREIGPKRRRADTFPGRLHHARTGGERGQYTYVRQVEDTGTELMVSGWETINAGVDGLGTNGELAVLSETGLSVSPDVVVLGFYHNDFLESPGSTSRAAGACRPERPGAPTGERRVSDSCTCPRRSARGATHRRC